MSARKKTSLFKPSRVCVCCERAATPRFRKPGEPSIASIAFKLYFRDKGKYVEKASPSVLICTDCLAKALAEPTLFEGPQARKFLAAVRQSLSGTYRDVLEADALNQVHRPRFDDSGNLLGDAE